jgi:small subunit ribosomal protein S16
LAVKIRLRRMGAKKRPFYRIVVADSRTARGGRFIDQLGYFDPTTEPPVMKIDEEKTKMWLGRGAQPTDTARALLKKSGVIGTAQAETPAPVAEEKAPEAAPKRRKKAAAKTEEA